jgi:hypothetical protein
VDSKVLGLGGSSSLQGRRILSARVACKLADLNAGSVFGRALNPEFKHGEFGPS